MALGMGMCIVLAFSSCKSSESAYKKAYEKAKQQELAEITTPVEVVEEVTPVVETPVESEVTVVESTAVGTIRQEKVSVVSGEGLKEYSVVCGSFGVKANAENLKDFLDNEGYTAMIVYNADTSTYRVIASTHTDRASAVQAREAFKAKYPNREDFQKAWLLYSID